ncbi:MAG: hypothetical protein ISS19_15425, partial [Bacteroidales bacterium]|nr:hypothetical protein [Bacteroidales bacterium]
KTERLEADFCSVLLGYKEERQYVVDGQQTQGIIHGVDEFGRLLVEHTGKPIVVYAHGEIEYIL